MSRHRRFAGILLLTCHFGTGCASTPAGHAAPAAPHQVHSSAHSPQHRLAHGPGHFADPSRFVASWNAPERDAWQRPDEIVANLGLEPGMHVVDLGAGTGYLLPRLSAAVQDNGHVLATDVEPAMVAYLEEAKAQQGWRNIDVTLTPSDDPSLTPASVDAIVTLNVWHHIEGREAYARKLFDALRPGGVFLVVDYLAEETEGGGPPLAMRLSAAQVMEELRNGGFVVVQPEESLPRHYFVRGRKP